MICDTKSSVKSLTHILYDHTFPLLPQELPIYGLTGLPTYQLQTRFSNCVSGRSEMSECASPTPLSTTPLYTRAVAMATCLSPSLSPSPTSYSNTSSFIPVSFWRSEPTIMVLCPAKYSNPFTMAYSLFKQLTRCFC